MSYRSEVLKKYDETLKIEEDKNLYSKHLEDDRNTRQVDYNEENNRWSNNSSSREPLNREDPIETNLRREVCLERLNQFAMMKIRIRLYKLRDYVEYCRNEWSRCERHFFKLRDTLFRIEQKFLERHFINLLNNIKLEEN